MRSLLAPVFLLIAGSAADAQSFSFNVGGQPISTSRCAAIAPTAFPSWSPATCNMAGRTITIYEVPYVGRSQRAPRNAQAQKRKPQVAMLREPAIRGPQRRTCTAGTCRRSRDSRVLAPAVAAPLRSRRSSVCLAPERRTAGRSTAGDCATPPAPFSPLWLLLLRRLRSQAHPSLPPPAVAAAPAIAPAPVSPPAAQPPAQAATAHFLQHRQQPRRLQRPRPYPLRLSGWKRPRRLQRRPLSRPRSRPLAADKTGRRQEADRHRGPAARQGDRPPETVRQLAARCLEFIRRPDAASSNAARIFAAMRLADLTPAR